MVGVVVVLVELLCLYCGSDFGYVGVYGYLYVVVVENFVVVFGLLIVFINDVCGVVEGE